MPRLRQIFLPALLWACLMVATSCREAAKVEKTSKAKARESAFAERQELGRTVLALRHVREIARVETPEKRIAAIAAHIAGLEEANLPADVGQALRAYKESWAGFAAAASSRREPSELAGLARSTDTSGAALREVLAKRGFVETGL